jgi:hypothetical protein
MMNAECRTEKGNSMQQTTVSDTDKQVVLCFFSREKFDTLDAMEREGGGYVKALANAARRADANNWERLAPALAVYWVQYAQVAADQNRRPSVAKQFSGGERE